MVEPIHSCVLFRIKILEPSGSFGPTKRIATLVVERKAGVQAAFMLSESTPLDRVMESFYKDLMPAYGLLNKCLYSKTTWTYFMTMMQSFMHH